MSKLKVTLTALVLPLVLLFASYNLASPSSAINKSQCYPAAYSNPKASSNSVRRCYRNRRLPICKTMLVTLAFTSRWHLALSLWSGCSDPRERFKTSAVVRYYATYIELPCLLEMFFGQLSHAKVLQPTAEHPMKKRIGGSELIGLFCV